MPKTLSEKNQYLYNEIIVKSESDIHDLSKKLSMTNWIFRGQGDSEWKLETTIERYFNKIRKMYPNDIGFNKKYIESRILEEFQRSARHLINNPPPSENYLEWLHYIQHYSGVTRLLDFTKSLYIALYFAVKNNDYDFSKDAAIWCINIPKLYNRCNSKILKAEFKPIDQLYFSMEEVQNNKIYVPFEGYEKIILDLFDKKILKRPNEYLINGFDNSLVEPGVINFQPFIMNNRMYAQQGIFLAPLDIDVSFEENLIYHCSDTLQTDCEISINNYRLQNKVSPLSLRSKKYKDLQLFKSVILKVIIPSEYREKLYLSLPKMNIDEKTLFPDIEGIARHTFSKLYSFDPGQGDIDQRSIENAKLFSNKNELDLSDLAIDLYEQGSYVEAINKNLKFIELEKKKKKRDYNKIANAYNNIGIICYNIKNPFKGIEYLQEAIKIYEKVRGKDNSNIALAHLNIGTIFYKSNKNPDDSIKHLKKSLDMYVKIGQRYRSEIPELYYILGELYFQKEMNEKAAESYEKCLDLSKKGLVRGSFDESQLISKINSCKKADSN